MLSLFCANFILFSLVVVVVVVLEMYDNEFLNKGEKTMIQLNHNIVMYMAFAVFQVRGWAIASVRDSGLLNPDDYDFLAEVIGWMMNVVQFNLFENIYSLIQQNDADRELPFDFLPPHLFMELDKNFYWQSLFVLIRQMDVSTVQTCFMTSQPGHDELLTTILLSMEEQGNNFFLIILQPLYYALVQFYLHCLGCDNHGF